MPPPATAAAPASPTDPLADLAQPYADLPEVLWERVDPTPAGPADQAQVFWLNTDLGPGLGVDAAALDPAVLAGARTPEGSTPIAQAYAGHQFGHFTMLGDGRAVLLGHRCGLDVQLKGAGRTAFSRGGDGRATLGPMLREALIGEALHALGVPTSRALAVTTTGRPVVRVTPSFSGELPGAVLLRTAPSHVRVGTFQFAAACGEPEALPALIEHTLTLMPPETPQSPAGLLGHAVEANAGLVAAWMRLGFVHGVLNTDNLSPLGFAFDFGPCAFLETHSPDAVFSAIDRGGRYAYGNQPSIVAWNLARLAEALLPSGLAVQEAQAILDRFPQRYEHHLHAGYAQRLGVEPEAVPAVLEAMAGVRVDHHRFLRERSHAFPAVVPRNHHVEAALRSAELDGDPEPFRALLHAVRHPFEPHPEFSEPDVTGRACVTHCGT